jgi:MFS family permease
MGDGLTWAAEVIMRQSEGGERTLTGLRAVPAGVWALGFVSMFMDVSSEMIHSLLPVFLVTGLGASVVLVGLIEGAAEATASITKVFSGYLSDRLGRRKLLTVLGYGLGALTKPIFPLAVTPFEVFGARFADRIGKGIRGAPRDAMVADLAPPEVRGAAFGLRQSLDTIGAFAGPLIAIGLMVVLAGDIRGVFAWAIVPALIAIVVLIFCVKEPVHPDGKAPVRAPITWSEVGSMGRPFWLVVGFGVAFTMARFSEAFLVLRAQDVGLPIALVPIVMVVMNVVYALVATPAGTLSDRIDRRWILAMGLGFLIAADVVLAFWASVPGVILGVALWGLHMGLTQGLLAALVVDTSPPRLRGTAFGLFNLASGVTLLAASTLGGLLWSSFGASATFLSGAGFSVIALLGLLMAGRRPR